MPQNEKEEHRNFSSASDVRLFEHGKAEVMNIAGGSVGRLTLNPGWKWSKDVKPIAKTEWCEAPHFQYVVTGTLHVKTREGSEFDLKPGDVSFLPPGHDAWVVGNEAAVVVDWHGASNYAKS
jgi:mannose-6-phosphate isomerase-like protein (cupin superfamily)